MEGGGREGDAARKDASGHLVSLSARQRGAAADAAFFFLSFSSFILIFDDSDKSGITAR